MNHNITSTATVVAEPQVDDQGRLVVSVAAQETYVNAENEIAARTLLLFLRYGRDVEELSGTIKANSRVAFTGFFTGPTFIKNESNPNKLTVNGPRVYLDENDEPYTALDVIATSLKVIGPPSEKRTDYDDVTNVLLWGFLGRDAEMAYTPSAKLVVRTSLAFNRFKFDEVDGERIRTDITTWWRLSIWGDPAETAANWWKRGTALIVSGMPAVDAATGAPNIWKDQQGQWRASYDMNVHRWTFAPGKRNGGPSAQARDEEYSAPVTFAEEDIPF